jgi:uncharacterized glyoxalase superfamily protein PhnB
MSKRTIFDLDAAWSAISSPTPAPRDEVRGGDKACTHRSNDITYALRAPRRPRQAVTLTGVRANRSIPAATVIPVLIYPDVRAAVDWLSAAFGFVERIQIGDDHRSQMNVGEGGAVIIGDVRHDRVPPRKGEVTHQLKVRVEDVESHFARAREHGAEILSEPTDYEYGQREYLAADPWGHQWEFSETLEDVHPEVWGGILKAPE